jgi:hypothetical protein
MRTVTIRVFVAVLFAWGAAPVMGQLTTTDLNSVTPAELVDVLVDVSGGAIVSNVTYSGANVAAGTFSGGTGILGFESGVVLSSGDIALVVGPNSFDDTTVDNGTGGDSDLDTLIPGFSTFDAAVLEFDFVCENIQTISFQYVFVSEEYNEFTNSEFNNVFGFFVNGVNVALLPDKVTPVSINNVNGGNLESCFDGTDNDGDLLVDFGDPDCTASGDNIVGEDNSNSAFFINNDCDDPDGGIPCPIDIEADGLTVVLTAEESVNPGVNHIKLAISDAGDSILDSNVFIQENSFQCKPAETGQSLVAELKVKKDKKEDPPRRYAKSLHLETYNTNPELLVIWEELFGEAPGTSTLTMTSDRRVTWKEGTLEMGGVMKLKVKTKTDKKTGEVSQEVKIEKSKSGTVFGSATGGVDPNIADGGWHGVKVKGLDDVVMTFDGFTVAGFLKELKLELDKDSTAGTPIIKAFKVVIRGETDAPDISKGTASLVSVDVPETVVIVREGTSFEEEIKEKPEATSGHTEAEHERDKGALTEAVDISPLDDGNNEELTERKGKAVVTE